MELREIEKRKPSLKHFKLCYDDDLTEEENELLMDNPENWYIYDSFSFSDITEDSIMWKLQPYEETINKDKYFNDFKEIYYFVDGERKCTGDISVDYLKGLSCESVYPIEVLAKNMKD